jgi:phytoene dehydrogenase-like protein
MSASHDVVVIGAGANGLVAATALARAGRHVIVVEAEEAVGGTWRPVEIASGVMASLETEADWVPPAVAAMVGISASDFNPAPPTSVLVDPGKLLTLPAEVGAAVTALKQHAPKDAARWPAFMAMVRQLAAFLETMYQLPAPEIGASSVADLSGLLTLGRSYRALGRTNMSELLRVLPMPVEDLAEDWMTFMPVRAAIAAAGVRDISQGPRSGGTSFVLLHYLAGAPEGSLRGRPQLRGGPGAFIAMAERAARAAGVAIRTGARVARIEVKDDRVVGAMLTTGEMVAAPLVLSTADPSATLLGLVDPVWLDPELLHAVRNIKYRGSTAYVCYALERMPELPSGVISLSSSTDAIERPYDASKYGEASPMPHVVMTAHPENGTLVAKARYIPFALRDGAWDESRKAALADLVTSAVGTAVPRFKELVRECRVFTPPDLAARFGIREGAMTHGEITLDQILFMRPVAGLGRHAMPIAGLYLGGAGTHPGPGIAGGPGLLAARQLLKDSRKGK